MRAGKYADAEDYSTVTPECVRKAASSVYSVLRKDELFSLRPHEKMFLLGLARYFKQSENIYVSLIDAEQAYTVICEEFNVKPHSHTQLWKYLRMLSSIGIVSTKVSGTGSRGRSTFISLPRISAGELEREIDRILKKDE